MFGVHNIEQNIFVDINKKMKQISCQHGFWVGGNSTCTYIHVYIS